MPTTSTAHPARKPEAPKTEAEAPKAEAPKAEAPKAEAPKAEAPKAEAPKAEAPKAEAPKAEAPKADEFSFVMLPEELAQSTAPKNARSDRQVEMDKHVKRLHEAWQRAGSPRGAWPFLVSKRVVATAFVSPEKSAEHKRLMSRSAAFLGVHVKFGTPFVLTADLAKRYGRPEGDVGKEAITVAVMDKRARSATPAAEAVVDAAKAAAARVAEKSK